MSGQILRLEPDPHVAVQRLLPWYLTGRLETAEHDIVELCFSRDGVDFHFYALRRSDFPRIPDTKGPQTGELEGMGYVLWTHGDQQFMVVSRAGVDAIKSLL